MTGPDFEPDPNTAAEPGRPARSRTDKADKPGKADSMTLLALDAGVRETGWAVFRSDHGDGANSMDETGIISLPRSINVDGAARVKHLVRCLDELVSRWNPANVAYGQPSGIRWPVPSLQLLDDALVNWSANHRLPLYTYSAQEVRSAIAGHSHVPQDQLAYAIMARLGLIGQSRTTHEWEAIAIGYYHLGRWGAPR